MEGLASFVALLSGNATYVGKKELCASTLGYSTIQTLLRLVGNIPLIVVGIGFNLVNLAVFIRKGMRQSMINWFLLALAVCDLTMLVCNWFMFPLPVLVENWPQMFGDNAQALWLMNVYNRWALPVAHLAHTAVVCLTVGVNLYRYTGLCHPFRALTLLTGRRVLMNIVCCFVASAMFSAPRWFEVTTRPCLMYTTFNDSFHTLIIVQSDFGLMGSYVLCYKVISYTVFIYVIPFVVLTFANVRIYQTLASKKQSMSTQSTVIKSTSLQTTQKQRCDQSNSQSSKSSMTIRPRSATNGTTSTQLLPITRSHLTSEDSTKHSETAIRTRSTTSTTPPFLQGVNGSRLTSDQSVSQSDNIPYWEIPPRSAANATKTSHLRSTSRSFRTGYQSTSQCNESSGKSGRSRSATGYNSKPRPISKPHLITGCSTINNTSSLQRQLLLRNYLNSTSTEILPSMSSLSSSIGRVESCSSQSPSSADKESHAGRMLAAVAVLFVICNTLPFISNCLEIIIHYRPHLRSSVIGQHVFTVLVEVGNILITMNSTTSLPIYLLYSSKYRAECRLLVREMVDRLSRCVKGQPPVIERPTPLVPATSLRCTLHNSDLFCNPEYQQIISAL